MNRPKPVHSRGPISPRMRTPERRKNSSGASRPIMVKTASLRSFTSSPPASASATSPSSMARTLEDILTSIDPGRRSSSRKGPLEVVTRSEVGVSTETSAIGSAASASSRSRFSGLGRENSGRR